MSGWPHCRICLEGIPVAHPDTSVCYGCAHDREAVEQELVRSCGHTARRCECECEGCHDCNEEQARMEYLGRAAP